jgi:hypothetical protein
MSWRIDPATRDLLRGVRSKVADFGCHRRRIGRRLMVVGLPVGRLSGKLPIACALEHACHAG